MGVGHLSSASRRAVPAPSAEGARTVRPPPPLPPRGAALGGRRRRRRRRRCLPGPERGSAVPLSLPPSFPPRRRRPDSFRDGGRDTQVRQSRGSRGVPSRAPPAGAAPPRVPVRGCRGAEPPPPSAGPSVCGAARAQGLCLAHRCHSSRKRGPLLKTALTVRYKGSWPRLPNPFESQHC